MYLSVVSQVMCEYHLIDEMVQFRSFGGHVGYDSLRERASQDVEEKWKCRSQNYLHMLLLSEHEYPILPSLRVVPTHFRTKLRSFSKSTCETTTSAIQSITEERPRLTFTNQMLNIPLPNRRRIHTHSRISLPIISLRRHTLQMLKLF